MGLPAFAPRSTPLSLLALVELLRTAAPDAMVVMVDGNFLAPGRPLPEGWRDVRVRTPAGTLTLLPRPDGIEVVVFGNADDALRHKQQDLVAALRVT